MVELAVQVSKKFFQVYLIFEIHSDVLTSKLNLKNNERNFFKLYHYMQIKIIDIAINIIEIYLERKCK